ncbi:MAG: hypothetical protein ABFR89_02555 [Actinomycetota bacterium]
MAEPTEPPNDEGARGSDSERVIDWSTASVKELKAELKARGATGVSKMNKGELLDALENA